MDNKMTIAFIGFDGYSDMWDDCMGLFHQFWKDCPYRVIFVNNEKDVSFEGVEVLHAGKDAEWSRKVQAAIDATNTPYICLLLEDFLVGKEINTETVKEVVNLIEENNIRYYKLVNMNRAVRNRDPLYKNIRGLHVIPESDEYGVSLQAAIWDKKYLLELVGTENYNAWTFEFDRVHEAKGLGDEPKIGCVFDDRNILELKHGVMQSKYLPSTIKYFDGIGIKLNVSRPVMTYRNYYRIRLQSKIKYSLPRGTREYLKKIMERFGYKFVSTVRDQK